VFKSVVGRAGDSPRFTGSERVSPPGQGGAPEAETVKESPPVMAGFEIIEDLEWVGCLLP